MWLLCINPRKVTYSNVNHNVPVIAWIMDYSTDFHNTFGRIENNTSFVMSSLFICWDEILIVSKEYAGTLLPIDFNPLLCNNNGKYSCQILLLHMFNSSFFHLVTEQLTFVGVLNLRMMFLVSLFQACRRLQRQTLVNRANETGFQQNVCVLLAISALDFAPLHKRSNSQCYFESPLSVCCSFSAHTVHLFLSCL